jgi:hypothetical protein
MVVGTPYSNLFMRITFKKFSADTLKREHRQRETENRVRRRIFGPKNEDMTGDWRRLHNEELHTYMLHITGVNK